MKHPLCIISTGSSLRKVNTIFITMARVQSPPVSLVQGESVSRTECRMVQETPFYNLKWLAIYIYPYKLHKSYNAHTYRSQGVISRHVMLMEVVFPVLWGNFDMSFMPEIQRSHAYMMCESPLYAVITINE